MNKKKRDSSQASTNSCILCGSSSSALVRYVSVGGVEKEYVQKHFGEIPPDESFLCRKHVLEASRHHNHPDFIPKWKPQRDSCVQKCMNPLCSNSDYKKVITPAFRPVSDICRIIGLELSTSDLVLCVSCYQDVWHYFHCCQSCGAIPKTGKFYHHSPDPERISSFFQETSGGDMHLKRDDCLCLTCYKVHLKILKQLDVKEEGSDATLRSMIEGWRLKLESEELDSLLAAVLKTVQHVANNLLQERALLLPLVCRVFLKAYGVHHADSIQSLNLEIDTGKSRVKLSSRWLLNQLILHLSPLMSFKCVHMRVGTILYRQGGNIMASLSLALSETKSGYLYQEETSSAPDTDTINELLHNEIITQSTFCTNQFYIDEYLQSINPLLSQFIQSATKAHEQYEHDLGNNAVSKHVKKVRQYFILCQLLYCTNPMKVPPIHNMLADIVEVCGGSRQLLRILNRLGCTSSPDTHDRLLL